MKITIPAKVKEVCDICHGDGFLQTCLTCKGRYCLTCDAIMAGCVHEVDVCRKCSDRQDVQILVKRWAPRISAVIKKRDNQLRHLPIHPQGGKETA